MKQTLSFLLTLLLIFSFVGCDKKEENKDMHGEMISYSTSPYYAESVEVFLDDIVWSKNNSMEIPELEEIGGEAWDIWFAQRNNQIYALAYFELSHIHTLLIPTVNHEAFQFVSIIAASDYVTFHFKPQADDREQYEEFSISMSWKSQSMYHQFPCLDAA